MKNISGKFYTINRKKDLFDLIKELIEEKAYYKNRNNKTQ
jgi:hypothetical protein